MQDQLRMNLNTDAIDSRGYFDPRYTCDADNSSPELRWENAPENTAGFAVVAQDLNGAQVHWVIYNIPEKIHHLPAGIPPQEILPNGIKQGINHHGKLGYAGPCPPAGAHAHRYIFKLYALSALPEIAPRFDHKLLMQVIEPHILSSCEIVGHYQRLFQKAG
jgi:Raf kinase inhibitor-like YbhB/YbcL family protein